MSSLLTTQSQNCYREQIQKEMLARLAWKRRYAELYPSCCDSGKTSAEETQRPHQLPELSNKEDTGTPSRRRVRKSPLPWAEPPVVTKTPKKKNEGPPAPLQVSSEEEGHLSVPPLMRPVSPQTRGALYQGEGRSLYLQRRGRIRPEEKFDFPVLSSWVYGWRLGDYTLDYKTPSRAKSSVVKNTFYARNGVFSNPSPTDTLG